MAELETFDGETTNCCSPAAQETCCEPEAKAECCGEGHGDDCGCSASRAIGAEDVREVVRERYAAAATAAHRVHEHAASAVIRARLGS